MMEELEGDLQELDKCFLRELIDAVTAIAPEYSGDAQQLVCNIPLHYYLEETLAADDPLRLAELEAQRDAEEIKIPDINTTNRWHTGLRRRDAANS